MLTGADWDATGGWYDAGDYGKYVVNAGITLGTLMLSNQWYPKAVGDDLRNPESGNGVNDLADEIAWELKWMAKMQDPADGGVYFKVGSLVWDGFVPPKDTKYDRVVMGKSTTSSLDFAAAMAGNCAAVLLMKRRNSSARSTSPCQR